MKTMASSASLDKSVTNHSLRAYGVTKMYTENVPENIIMEQSGHQSLEGVRQYERTSAVHDLNVCQVLEQKSKSKPVNWPLHLLYHLHPRNGHLQNLGSKEAADQ